MKSIYTSVKVMTLNLALLLSGIAGSHAYAQETTDNLSYQDTLSVPIGPAQRDLEVITIGVAEPKGLSYLQASQALKDCLTEALALNGVAGGETAPFVAEASVSLLSKSLTGTTPVMYVWKLSVSVVIRDTETDYIFSQTSFNVKGVGETDADACIAALRNIRSRDAKLRMMITQAKEKIATYYSIEL